MTDKTLACPKCGGKSGYQYTMRVAHIMVSTAWGESPECVADEGRVFGSSQGWVICLDCKSRLRYSVMKRKGLVDP